jgi:hypothetical protein
VISETKFHTYTKLQAELQFFFFKFLDSRREDERFWAEW